MHLDSFLPRRASAPLALRAVLAVLLVLQPMVIFPEPAIAQPPTLGVVLDQLQATLDALLNDARTKGIELALVFGAQVATEIDAARQELHTELDFQQQQWSATAESLVSNVTNAINDIKNNAFAQAEDLLNQTQLTVLALPFADRSPRVRSFTPIVTFQPPDGVNDLVFNVAGLFPDAGGDKNHPDKYLPKLTFNGKSYPAASAPSAFSAQFHVPKDQLQFVSGSAIKRITAGVKARR